MLIITHQFRLSFFCTSKQQQTVSSIDDVQHDLHWFPITVFQSSPKNRQNLFLLFLTLTFFCLSLSKPVDETQQRHPISDNAYQQIQNKAICDNEKHCNTIQYNAEWNETKWLHHYHYPFVIYWLQRKTFNVVQACKRTRHTYIYATFKGYLLAWSFQREILSLQMDKYQQKHAITQNEHNMQVHQIDVRIEF